MNLLFGNAGYPSFQSVYISCEIVRILVQLVDSGLLVVDVGGQLVEQVLQTQTQQDSAALEETLTLSSSPSGLSLLS